MQLELVHATHFDATFSVHEVRCEHVARPPLQVVEAMAGGKVEMAAATAVPATAETPLADLRLLVKRLEKAAELAA